MNTAPSRRRPPEWPSRRRPAAGSHQEEPSPAADLLTVLAWAALAAGLASAAVIAVDIYGRGTYR